MSLDFSLLDEREEPKLKVNFCMEEELRCIPGVGAQLAHTIVMLRMSHGNMDAELLLLSNLVMQINEKATFSVFLAEIRLYPQP